MSTSDYLVLAIWTVGVFVAGMTLGGWLIVPRPTKAERDWIKKSFEEWRDDGSDN